MVRPGVIVSTAISLCLCFLIVVLLFPRAHRYGPLPNYSVSMNLDVAPDAQGRLIEALRRFAILNGFEFDLRSEPPGPPYFSVGMLRKQKDVVVVVSARLIDDNRIEVAVIQDDENAATPPRVDALSVELIDAIRGLSGVAIQVPRPARIRI